MKALSENDYYEHLATKLRNQQVSLHFFMSWFQNLLDPVAFLETLFVNHFPGSTLNMAIKPGKCMMFAIIHLIVMWRRGTNAHGYVDCYVNGDNCWTSRLHLTQE